MDEVWRRDSWFNPTGVRQIRSGLVASVILAVVLAAFVVVRRLSGNLDASLAPMQLIIVATLLLAWALAVRVLVPGRLTTWLVSFVLLSVAVACSFPGERAVDWIVWLTVFGAFVASHNAVAVLPARRRSASIQTISTDRVLQQLTRSRSADGQDVLHGTLLAEFAAGERSVSLYVAFCPPFERLPLVELESSADARLVQTLNNGAQIEVRLPRAAKAATTATVEFYATDAE